MIAKKDIDNVRDIMVKASLSSETETDKRRYENLIRSFDDASNRYLQEVSDNARLH